MSSVNKDEITELLKRTNDSDPVETQVAIWISLISFLVIFLGVLCWSYLYLAPPFTDLAVIFIVTLLGSTFLGVTLFFYSTGSYLYFRVHLPELPIHWLFQPIFRTLIQIYYTAAYVIIFLSSQRFYSYLELEFFFMFFLFAFPAIISYPLARWHKIRNQFEQIATNYARQNNDLIIDDE
ncbi:MAG: hypothetical protein ACFFDT_07160 [Candidatus Hodarchaeota archaeon]